MRWYTPGVLDEPINSRGPMPMFGVASPAWAFVGLAAASVWLGWHATAMVRSHGEVLAFHQINVYALLVITLLSLSVLV